jgi:hypothetical protein
MGREEECIWWKSQKERDHYEDLAVDGSIKWILEK